MWIRLWRTQGLTQEKSLRAYTVQILSNLEQAWALFRRERGSVNCYDDADFAGGGEAV